MSSIYYGKVNSLTQENYSELSKSKPTDKIILFCGADESISADQLIPLNNVSAKVEYQKIESEADMYFILGMNFQSGTSVFLGGIHVPEQIMQAMGTSGTKRRKPRRTKAEEMVQIKENSNPQEQKEPAFTEKTEASSKVYKGIQWMSDSSKEAFWKYCGVPEDTPDRDVVVNEIAKIISEKSSAKEMVKYIKEKYPEIAENVKRNIKSSITCFKGAAFKDSTIE